MYFIIPAFHFSASLLKCHYQLSPVTFSLPVSHRMNSDTVDYEDSCLIVRYLASMRPFAQSFDIYLTQVRYSFLHCICIFFIKHNNYNL